MIKYLMETVTCLACGGDGSLLLCSEEGCEFAVHDKCLPCSAYFDASGIFYCPQCAYDLAVEECIQAKKHALLAKEGLLKFISASVSKSEQAEVKDIERKQSVPKNSEKDICHPTRAGEVREKEKSEICKDADLNKKVIESEILVIPGLVEDCHETEMRDADGFPCISTATKQKGNTDELLEETEESSGKDELFVEDSDIFDSDFGTPINAKLKVKRVQKEKIRVTYARRNKNDLDFKTGVADEILKQGQDRDLTTSSQKRKFIHSDDSGSIPTSSKTRRRKQWSDAEVEILKEGVQKLSVPTEKMPWNRILEYGSHVFEKCRTAVDLKDKWRNLTK